MGTLTNNNPIDAQKAEIYSCSVSALKKEGYSTKKLEDDLILLSGKEISNKNFPSATARLAIISLADTLDKNLVKSGGVYIGKINDSPEWDLFSVVKEVLCQRHAFTPQQAAQIADTLEHDDPNMLSAIMNVWALAKNKLFEKETIGNISDVTKKHELELEILVSPENTDRVNELTIDRLNKSELNSNQITAIKNDACLVQLLVGTTPLANKANSHYHDALLKNLRPLTVQDIAKKVATVGEQPIRIMIATARLGQLYIKGI